MGKTLENAASELPWLWSFDDDGMRLAAVGVVALAIVITLCGRHVVTAWRLDRANKRIYELENTRLQARITARRKRSEP